MEVLLSANLNFWPTGHKKNGDQSTHKAKIMKRETILTCTIHWRGTCEGHLDGINRKVMQTRYIHHLPPCQKCSSLIRAGNISNLLALDCTAYHLCNSAILVGRNGSNSGHIKGSPSTNFFLPRAFCRASPSNWALVRSVCNIIPAMVNGSLDSSGQSSCGTINGGIDCLDCSPSWGTVFALIRRFLGLL